MLYVFLTAVAIFTLTIIFIRTAFKPSNNRDWSLDQSILPYAEINGDTTTIRNIRNFTYTSKTDYSPDYYDKTFNLEKIKNVYYAVSPFGGIPGSAHAFLSFEFEDNNFIAISIEIRKKKGVAYHPIKGLFNQYEIMYVIADERDVIKLRTNYRKDPVYLYPVKANKENIKRLFLNMIQKTNHLKEHPEFYNTIANACVTEVIRHINAAGFKRMPLFNLNIIFPKNSDKLVYKFGFLNTDLPFEEARKKFLINERAEKYAESPDFSVKIRTPESAS